MKSLIFLIIFVFTSYLYLENFKIYTWLKIYTKIGFCRRFRQDRFKGDPLDRTPLMVILSQACRSQFSTFTCDLGIKSHLKNPENSFLCMSEARAHFRARCAPYYMNTPNFHVTLFPVHWGFSSACSARASRRARTKI